MKRDVRQLVTITDAKAANGAGNSINVEYWRDKEISLDSAGSAAMIVKFVGSYQDTAPTFTSAQSVNNQWDYVAVRDREDNSVIEGDTGITLSAADDNRHFNVEANNLVWLSVIISSYTAGSVTIKLKCAND